MVGVASEELPVLSETTQHQPPSQMTKVNKKANLSLKGNRQGTTTSDRYNRGQLYKNNEKSRKSYLFTVDTLVLNCVPSLAKGLLRDFDYDAPCDSYEQPDVMIVKDKATGNGTKMFKYGYDVSYCGQSFGLLLLAPRQSYREEFSCSFKIHNHILYQKAWGLILEIVLEKLGLEIQNVTNLDIACDGHGFISDYKKLLKGKYVNVGRADHRPAKIRKKKIFGFYIGTRKSDKCMCGYDKFDELKKSNKTYISDWWERNGLKNLDRVERLELRLKNKAVKQIIQYPNKFNFSLLENPIYLAGIYKAHTTKYYEFVLQKDLDKDSNISRARKIPIIDWKQLQILEMEKIKKVNKPSSVWGVKRYITCGLQLIEAGYYPSKNLFENEEYLKLKALSEEYTITVWFDSLVHRIAKRDKSLIAEMKYNRMEIEAGNTGIYDLAH